MKNKDKLLSILILVFSFIALILMTLPSQLDVTNYCVDPNLKDHSTITKVFTSFWNTDWFIKGNIQSPFAATTAYLFLAFTICYVFIIVLKDNKWWKLGFKIAGYIFLVSSIILMIVILSFVNIDLKLEYTKYGLTPVFIIIFMLLSGLTFICSDLRKYFKINEKAIWKDEGTK
ncbi:hypothetical protein [Mycoplasma seminis]|uniref:DUF4293 family protein n=1 Tax=Mycoplasma seminis TaxID=512749 RepID=A0ABY9HAB1_9MOLU|nr:hypothetical protein [Mycoplasma seminis]WLP85525.1 hypothetical protein Q8852_04385 [Mycoplasma seminis]